MNNDWIGYMVSVCCKDDLGTYQGQISGATSSTLTLIKAFHNGVPYPEAEVTLSASDIEDLMLIDSQPNSNTNGQSTVTVAKPVPKRAGRSVSMSECTSVSKQNNSLQNHSKTKPIDIDQKLYNGNDFNLYKNGTPNKKDKSKTKWVKGWRDEACFGTSMETSMLQDFDFEKNLALFNKEAVWEEINASQKPDVVHQTDSCRRQQKYRHDENVIATLPTAFRQITVPAPDTREYVTDDGLVIPSITAELRRELFAVAEKRGLTVERQTELMGRAATEMALQLLGGGHRLNPHNSHQSPTVVLLCGQNRQGVIGINCARQLASHGVNTVVYTPSLEYEGVLQNELQLYKLTRNKLTIFVSSLPQIADLIILALCGDSAIPGSFVKLVEWTNNNRAPVLALDPPVEGSLGISTKFSLVPVLPLSHSPENGKIYLCNLGYPLKVFSDIGIKYRSPFGPKFVIPLHPNDT